MQREGKSDTKSDDSSDDEDVVEGKTVYALATADARRQAYSRRQLAEADAAWEFIQRGLLSRAAATALVESSPDLVGGDHH